MGASVVGRRNSPKFSGRSKESDASGQRLAARLTMVLQCRAQILPVGAFAEPTDDCFELRVVDKSEIKSDLLRTADLESLAHFKHTHEVRRVAKQVGGAGVEPREATAHPLDVKRARVEIDAIDVGNLVLPARGWFESLGSRPPSKS